jgi:hypothetical protein
MAVAAGPYGMQMWEGISASFDKFMRQLHFYETADVADKNNMDYKILVNYITHIDYKPNMLKTQLI